MKRLFAFVPAFLIAFGVFVGAAGAVSAAEAGPTPPISAEAKAAGGGKCVAPVDVMRREHMNLLQDQRDATLREGRRGMKYSLQGCVECHAVADPKNPGTRFVKPFCKSCHEYASVSIDCFTCHTGRARGMTPDLKGLIPLAGAENKARSIEEMQAFLRAHPKDGTGATKEATR